MVLIARQVKKNLMSHSRADSKIWSFDQIFEEKILYPPCSLPPAFWGNASGEAPASRRFRLHNGKLRRESNLKPETNALAKYFQRRRKRLQIRTKFISRRTLSNLELKADGLVDLCFGSLQWRVEISADNFR